MCLYHVNPACDKNVFDPHAVELHVSQALSVFASVFPPERHRAVRSVCQSTGAARPTKPTKPEPSKPTKPKPIGATGIASVGLFAFCVA